MFYTLEKPILLSNKKLSENADTSKSVIFYFDLVSQSRALNSSDDLYCLVSCEHVLSQCVKLILIYDNLIIFQYLWPWPVALNVVQGQGNFSGQGQGHSINRIADVYWVVFDIWTIV